MDFVPLKTDEFFPLEDYVHVVREHWHSIEQVFPVVPATTYDLFVTVEAPHQALRSFCGKGDRKVDKPSEVDSTPVAGSNMYGTDEMYDADLNDEDWDPNDADATPGAANAARTREVQVSFAKVIETRRTARLRVPNAILDLSSELAEALVAVATSSALAGSPGASVLSPQNELLWAHLLKTQRLLHA